MIRATKEVGFACAHILAGHNGLCKNLHGHNYKVQVTVERISGNVLKYGPAEGMVVDFKDLKEILNEIIVIPYDHAYVIDNTLEMSGPNEAAIKVAEVVRGLELKHVLFPGRPTAENMCKVFAEDLQKALGDYGNTRITSVKVWETDTSYAEWTRGE